MDKTYLQPAAGFQLWHPHLNPRVARRETLHKNVSVQIFSSVSAWCAGATRNMESVGPSLSNVVRAPSVVRRRPRGFVYFSSCI